MFLSKQALVSWTLVIALIKIVVQLLQATTAHYYISVLYLILEHCCDLLLSIQIVFVDVYLHKIEVMKLSRFSGYGHLET
jgi:hypothetical protein